MLPRRPQWLELIAGANVFLFIGQLIGSVVAYLFSLFPAKPWVVRASWNTVVVALSITCIAVGIRVARELPRYRPARWNARETLIVVGFQIASLLALIAWMIFN
jgi:hypothetical protein